MRRDAIIARYAGVQTFLKDSCLFLCLMSIAEEFTGQVYDLLALVSYAKAQGYIDKKNEMSVAGQCALLRDLTGKQWKRESFKVLPTVVPDNMFTVERWFNARTGYTHFKRRYMDTLVNSITVAEGVRTEYYGYIVCL